MTNMKNTMNSSSPEYIKVIGKVSDSLIIEFHYPDGDPQIYDGYVPEFLSDENYGGDYIAIEIDINSGRIKDWDVRKQQLMNFINQE